jgi:hypothetical protein
MSVCFRSQSFHDDAAAVKKRSVLNYAVSYNSRSRSSSGGSGCSGRTNICKLELVRSNCCVVDVYRRTAVVVNVIVNRHNTDINVLIIVKLSTDTSQSIHVHNVISIMRSALQPQLSLIFPNSLANPQFCVRYDIEDSNS